MSTRARFRIVSLAFTLLSCGCPYQDPSKSLKPQSSTAKADLPALTASSVNSSAGGLVIPSTAKGDTQTNTSQDVSSNGAGYAGYCEISQAACDAYPAATYLTGNFRDVYDSGNQSAADATGKRCMQRAMDFALYCQNPEGSITAAQYITSSGLVTNVTEYVVGDPGHCQITQPVCPTYPAAANITGEFTDVYDGATPNSASSPDRCLQRARDFALYCDNPTDGFPTIAVYYSNTTGEAVSQTVYSNSSSSTTAVGASCVVTLDSCPNQPSSVGTFVDPTYRAWVENNPAFDQLSDSYSADYCGQVAVNWLNTCVTGAPNPPVPVKAAWYGADGTTSIITVDSSQLQANVLAGTWTAGGSTPTLGFNVAVNGNGTGDFQTSYANCGPVTQSFTYTISGSQVVLNFPASPPGLCAQLSLSVLTSAGATTNGTTISAAGTLSGTTLSVPGLGTLTKAP